ncbi:hypothetical protein JL101_036315 (plasmid) [Skermanella rosea]|uniref:hypothetical protein n=1 Tax=Skermanella rosea TaxID=1817965 RepID=UPI0019349B15|nr:hypothetical protein [Skermanella rosea]UEM08161.1 hypothetical protein JL101_036315 [Skermanella rosea]
MSELLLAIAELRRCSDATAASAEAESIALNAVIDQVPADTAELAALIDAVVDDDFTRIILSVVVENARALSGERS